MSDPGYYRYPTLHHDTIIFVSEDDLWTVSAAGGVPRRLTSGLGAASHPALSPDGQLLAFTGREEGAGEVYVVDAQGGQPRRLTFVGGATVIGWAPDGRIIFSSTLNQPFNGMSRAYAIRADGEPPLVPELLPVGPANFVSFDLTPATPAQRGVVIARNQVEPAFWKRYHGGTAGDLWIDPRGTGQFRRLVKVAGNPARPWWVGGRIYFLSDHEGVGNLYSCTPAGKDLRRHTHHDDFYARHLASDGRQLIYHAGADLFLFDPASNESRRIEIDYRSPRTQRNRKFVEPPKYLESYAVHPKGHLLTLTTRGKIAALGHWEGPAQQLGEPHAGRYRLAAWLHDGQRLVAVSDAEGQETLTVHTPDDLAPPRRLDGLDIGRVVSMKTAPKSDHVLLANVRNELVLADLAAGQMRVLDRSSHGPIWGFDFSPDGKWVAYSYRPTLHTSIIKLCRLEDGATFPATRAVLRDADPVFDPEGKYLYFISHREFDPVYDQLHFDLSFPRGSRPYLIPLRKDLPNPFQPQPKPAEEKKDEKKEAVGPAVPAAASTPAPDASAPAEPPFTIDLDGLEDRVLAFPVAEGIYQQLGALKGKALFASVPIEGSLRNSWYPAPEPPAKATLDAWDFEASKADTLAKGITDFALSADRKTLVYRAGNRLRVLKAGDKADDATASEPPGRKSGWVDLRRLRVSVEPAAEWRQMYGEAWRLQREQFWVEDLSKVDWQLIYQRYLPLLDRVSTRGEFSDLLWEMQGELGSSHAYVMGGDLREDPRYDLGFLGAELAWDAGAAAWRITHIARGDVWDEERSSPLARPGANVAVGDTILAVNGRRTDAATPPQALLVHQAGLEVALTLGDPAGRNPRRVAAKMLRNEMPLHYREWVEANRAWVHEQTRGKVGYVHIPNMGPLGYAEFHRYFLAEVDREALVIDVRYNGGGHVSALLLEKLARRRLAYTQTRYFGIQPWPEDAPAGPMVALTNEFAGSDGDIFSQNFKTMKLGPLLGKRTWGGVIGIWPRHTLVDGGVTTQPEFSFWFRDVGWSVENYGVDPDIEVENRPQDYAAGKDPQLARAVRAAVAQMRALKARPPKFGARPVLTLPRLPRTASQD